MNLPELYGYVLWLLPEKKYTDQIYILIQNLAKEYKSHTFFPHITLSSCPDNCSKNFLIHMADQLAEEFSAFSTKTLEIGSLNNEYHSLYIQVNNSKPLLSLRNSARKIMNMKSENDFYPHISLFYGFLTPDQRNRIKISLPGQIPESICMDRIALIRLNGQPDKWIMEYVKPL